MNTKIVAVLLASIVAISIVAMGVPAIIADEEKQLPIGADVLNELSETKWQELFITELGPIGVYPDGGQPPFPPEQCNITNITKCVLVYDLNGVPLDIVDVQVDINDSDGNVIDEEYLVDIENKIIQDIGCWAKLSRENPDLYDIAITNCTTYQMYYGYWDLKPCTPPGTYDMQCKAMDQSGNWSDWLHKPFEILSIVGIDVDVPGIYFGPVEIGVHKWIYGDDIWDPSNATVRNCGNVGINISVELKPVDGIPGLNGTTHGQIINQTNLDVEIDRAGAQWLPAEFKAYCGFLKPCNVSELDFSILVPPGYKPDSYTGEAKLTAEGCMP